MTYDQLCMLDLGSLLDVSVGEHHTPQERLQAAEAALARVPLWDGEGLSPPQLQRLKRLCRESGLAPLEAEPALAA